MLDCRSAVRENVVICPFKLLSLFPPPAGLLPPSFFRGGKGFSAILWAVNVAANSAPCQFFTFLPLGESICRLDDICLSHLHLLPPSACASEAKDFFGGDTCLDDLPFVARFVVSRSLTPRVAPFPSETEASYSSASFPFLSRFSRHFYPLSHLKPTCSPLHRHHSLKMSSSSEPDSHLLEPVLSPSSSTSSIEAIESTRSKSRAKPQQSRSQKADKKKSRGKTVHKR